MGEKVPPQARFRDFSDYARPAALWLAERLKATPVTPIHVTWAFLGVGLAGAGLLAWGTSAWSQGLAGLLILAKGWLDGVDGSLARLRNRPSRVGRFFDSLADFLVNLALVAAAARRIGGRGALLWAGGALLSIHLQGTFFNYYSLLYRHHHGGDRTSRIREEGDDGYPWDHPRVLAFLLAAYRWIYGWQDRLALWVDARLAGGRVPSRAFMEAVSWLGFGIHLLVFALAAWVGRPEAALAVVLGPMNLYLLILLGVRAWSTRREAPWTASR